MGGGPHRSSTLPFDKIGIRLGGSAKMVRSQLLTRWCDIFAVLERDTDSAVRAPVRMYRRGGFCLADGCRKRIVWVDDAEKAPT